jgi:hypothetical protein
VCVFEKKLELKYAIAFHVTVFSLVFTCLKESEQKPSCASLSGGKFVSSCIERAETSTVHKKTDKSLLATIL